MSVTLNVGFIMCILFWWFHN